MATETPKSITGGCLCGSVRYTVTFPPDHSFQTECATCQCSQCRKNSGALVTPLHRVPTSAVAYSARATLKTFRATPPVARGFCGECGGFLFWRDERTGSVSMAVGTFDQDVLRRWGAALADARTHVWCEDEIAGVTDHLQGEKWRQDRNVEGAERMN